MELDLSVCFVWPVENFKKLNMNPFERVSFYILQVPGSLYILHSSESSQWTNL
jgi:hypothetical protein